MIIQDDRIAAAACFLPLTPNPELSKEFGTRHRAALGITEETDAVAVVVSEETGIISVAFNGELIRDLDGKSLRNTLYKYLVTDLYRQPSHGGPRGRAVSERRAHLGPAAARPGHRHRHLVQRLGRGPRGLSERSVEASVSYNRPRGFIVLEPGAGP